MTQAIVIYYSIPAVCSLVNTLAARAATLWVGSVLFTAGGLQGEKCTLDIHSEAGIIEPLFSEENLERPTK